MSDEALVQRITDAVIGATQTVVVLYREDRAQMREAITPAIRSALAGGWAQEPVAYQHTLHMERGQTYVKYSELSDPTAVYGVRGANYYMSYRVTVQPLYLAPSAPLSLPTSCRHQFAYFGDEQKRRRCVRCNALEEAAPTPPESSGGVPAADARGFSLYLTREEWGVITDGLILEHDRTSERMKANSESTGSDRLAACDALLCRIGEVARSPYAPNEGEAQ